MNVREIMTKKVLTVSASWSIEELKSFLLEHSITGAPVVDDSKNLIGVVSATDLLREVSPSEKDDDFVGDYYALALERPLSNEEIDTLHVETESIRAVRDIMTPVVFKVDADSPLEDVAEEMVKGRVHRMLVTEGDALVGIVAALDMVRALRDKLLAEQKR